MVKITDQQAAEFTEWQSDIVNIISAMQEIQEHYEDDATNESREVCSDNIIKNIYTYFSTLDDVIKVNGKEMQTMYEFGWHLSKYCIMIGDGIEKMIGENISFRMLFNSYREKLFNLFNSVE